MHHNSRVSIKRLDRDELRTIQENIQSTVQRLTSRNPAPKPANALKDTTSTSTEKGYIASRIDPRQRQRLLSVNGMPKSFQWDDNEIDSDNDEDDDECDFSISSRRSPQIDGERIVLQHNPHGVAVSLHSFSLLCFSSLLFWSTHLDPNPPLL